MGREAASYWLAFPAQAEDAVAAAFARAGAELLCWEDARLDYCLYDPGRYWIDLRIHRDPESRVEIRVALTNDAWAIRAPLQRALTPLPEALEGAPLRDDEDNHVAVAGEERWCYALEADYDRRRAEFVARFGDFTAAIGTEHVYAFIHQARKRRDVSDAEQERRELELELLERIWEQSPLPGAAGN